MAAAPRLLSVRLADDLASIWLLFDQATDRAGMAGSAACKELLEPETVGRLRGSAPDEPLCTWQADDLLQARLPSGTHIQPQQPLTLRPGRVAPSPLRRRRRQVCERAVVCVPLGINKKAPCIR